MPLVAVEGYDVEVEARPGEPILAVLRRKGYTYKFGCRRGGCGVCMVHLVSGQVDYPKAVADTVLSAADRRGGQCLSCRAVPLTDVVIRLGIGDRLHTKAIFQLGGQGLSVPKGSDAK
ncbi:2Fe-2S iron-sulfur cluster-binding protein [Mycobacterium sp. 050134]|uniref:2Fe-2S iron-sulfur cluster-binding protein n=1 Tax=Mycobacterium sp. 050134 TaxID=3096111 RepID=UPI002EDA1927